MKPILNYLLSKNNYILLIISLGMGSCTSMYIPNAQHVPILSGKNDSHLALSPSNYQLAYAPTANLGVMINGYYRNSRYPSLYGGRGDTYDYHGVAKGLEGGIGYFKALKYSMVGIFGGGGKGFASISLIHDPQGGIVLESNYDKVFIQPFIVFGNQVVKGSFSTRVSYLNFDVYENLGPNQWRPPSNSKSNSKPFFIEPGTTLQVKLGWASFQSQLQFSSPTHEAIVSGSGYTSYKPMLVINLGFVFHVTELFQKRRAKS